MIYVINETIYILLISEFDFFFFPNKTCFYYLNQNNN